MPRPKPSKPRRTWAVQFRLPDEIEPTIKEFGGKVGQSDAETCRRLVALAISGMDVRHYPLVAALGDAMGGVNSFVRACVFLTTSLEAAARIDPELTTNEMARVSFLADIVRDKLASKGKKLAVEGPWSIQY